MSEDSIVTVCQNSNDGDIDIEEVIHEVDPDVFDELFYYLGSINPGCSLPIPWYRFIYPKICNSARKHDALVRIIGFQKYLIDHIEENDIDRVVCSDIDDEIYKTAVLDVATQKDIQTNVRPPRLKVNNAISTIIALYTSFVTLFDQLLGIISNLALTTSLDDANILVVPFPGRFSSMQPVMEDLNHITLLTTHHWVTWRFLSRKELNDRYGGYDAAPLAQYSSIQSILKQFRSIAEFSVESGFRRNLDEALIDDIQSEYDINAKYTIQLLLSSIYQNRGFRDIQYMILLESILSEYEFGKMVCGGLSPRDRAMLYIADRNQVETYYIPHGAGNYYQKYPDTETTHVGFGIPELKTYQLFRSEYHKARIELLGRPYLYEMIEQYENLHIDAGSDSRLNVLVATQPFNDHIRESFIDSVLDASSNIDRLDLRIKVHPSEDKEYYQTKVQDVPVLAQDLVYELKKADIVVTINSNVGLEAIVTGTPCICVNLWNAFTRAQYAEFGPIPVCESRSDISKWFNALDPMRLENLLETEESYVEENYLYDEKCAERISRYIECNGV